MKKVFIGIIAVAVVVAIVVSIIMISGKKEEKTNTQTGIKIETVEKMQEVLNDINEKLEDKLPTLDSREIDISDEYSFTSSTGLQSNKNVEAVIVLEPFISSQAFSAVMVKVSENGNVEEMKKEMIENIDMRKWICVSAEKAWATNYGNIIFLVMSDEEWGKPVYDQFKTVVGGTVGKELEREGETDELPEIPEM